MKTALLIFFFTLQVYSQTPSWHTLPNAPYVQDRFDDVYFINANTGWTVKSTIYLNMRIVFTYKTTNGGNSWDTSFTNFGANLPHYRCIGFFNENIGVAGILLSQPGRIHRTTNSGANWYVVTNHPGIPSGICGINIVDSITAFACGAFAGDARIVKTTNTGISWDSVSTDPSLIGSLVDCYFWSKDSGIVVGNSSDEYTVGSAAILKTTNSGISWQRTYLSTRTGEICWKISFVSKTTGFVSIERNSNISYILKTTNAGLNWTEIQFMNYQQQGIGFLNENTGWVGGFTGPTYETTNGGTNWHMVPWGYHLNRFRFINDTLAYSVGRNVYKYTRETIGIQQISSEVPNSFELHQNYPNPFNPSTKIKFDIPKSSFVTVKVFNALGKEIDVLVNQDVSAGLYSVNWNASSNPSGIYFYKLISENYSESKKMILIK